MTRTLFLLGGTGFIGQEVIKEGVAAGHTVRALGRSDTSRAKLAGLGAQPVAGDASDPASWGEELRGADVVIDLLQPALPKRLTHGNVAKMSAQRQAFTAGVLKALEGLPDGERPILFCISGADDLQPGADGRIDHKSPLREEYVGFSAIGIPVRRLAERSPVDATFVYFGNLVYGPGKAFAELIVDGLKKRKARVLGKGDNHLPLVHSSDAARAVVHLAGLERAQLAGKTFLATDGSGTTQRELFDTTAELMGRKPPGSVPAVIAGLVAGAAGVQTLTLDARDDPAALVATGFTFTYPSIREGVPAVLSALGEQP
jgi:nucleoside-diphosphate-sugar epimerase